MSTVFRVRFIVAGGNVHCRVACASRPGTTTFFTCGTLVVRKGDEFRDFMSAFSKADFIADDEKVGIEEAVKPGLYVS